MYFTHGHHAIASHSLINSTICISFIITFIDSSPEYEQKTYCHKLTTFLIIETSEIIQNKQPFMYVEWIQIVLVKPLHFCTTVMKTWKINANFKEFSQLKYRGRIKDSIKMYTNRNIYIMNLKLMKIIARWMLTKAKKKHLPCAILVQEQTRIIDPTLMSSTKRQSPITQ